MRTKCQSFHPIKALHLQLSHINKGRFITLMRCISRHQDTMFCLKICIVGVMVLASLDGIDAWRRQLRYSFGGTRRYRNHNVCKNGGTYHRYRKYGIFWKCICPSGWTGKYCHSKICDISNVCDNGGTYDSGTCICAAGWTGKTCNEKIPDKVCDNGGTNIDNSCVCTEDWTGETCNVLVHKYPVRLIPTGCENATIAAGRVEILINNTWGGVCDSGWDEKEAQVVCNMLGYTETTAVAVTDSVLGFSRHQETLNSISCLGNETELWDCNHAPFGEEYCRVYKRAGVLCLSDEPKIKIRLAGTSVGYMGRVEVQAFGIWGTVCKNSFGLEEVNVICRLLGYPGSGRVEILNKGKYGVGSGPVWMSNLGCFGNETAIEDCPGRPLGDNNCIHDDDDVGVYCDIV